MNKELILSLVVKKQGKRYSAWCPELDVASEGHSVEQAKLNLKEAVQCHVEAMVEGGDLDLLLDKLGVTKDEFKKHLLIPETFSGTFDVPLSV